MNSPQPIYFRTQEIEQARSITQQAWGDIHFETLSPTRVFDWNASVLDMGPISVMPSHLDTGVQLGGTVTSTIVSLIFRGQSNAGSVDDRAKIVRNRTGVIYSPNRQADWACTTGFSNVSVAIDPTYLQRQLELMTGVWVEQDILFQFGLSTARGPGHALERFCQFMVEHPHAQDSLIHPLVSSSLCEMIARLLLVGQPHDHAHLLERQPNKIDAHQVRRVEEYITANASGPIRLADLARLTGASGRSIEASFLLRRGVPVQAFVLRQRLEHLRKRLLTDATLPPLRALRQAGFVHAESVAIEYSRLFGESLQTTWMRAQVRGLSGLAAAAVSPTVFVVVGDAQLRASLAAGLSRSPYPVEFFDSIEAFLLADCSRRLGCVMIDLALPEHRRVAQVCPLLPRVGLSRGDAAPAIEAMRDGALDVLLTPIDTQTLLGAIERGFVQDAQQRRTWAEKEERTTKLATLTPREMQVCEQVSRGRLNKQIATDLGVSEAMVKAHRGRALDKLGVRSAAELARLFLLD